MNCLDCGYSVTNEYNQEFLLWLLSKVVNVKYSYMYR